MVVSEKVSKLYPAESDSNSCVRDEGMWKVSDLDLSASPILTNSLAESEDISTDRNLSSDVNVEFPRLSFKIARSAGIQVSFFLQSYQ